MICFLVLLFVVVPNRIVDLDETILFQLETRKMTSSLQLGFILLTLSGHVCICLSDTTTTTTEGKWEHL